MRLVSAPIRQAQGKPLVSATLNQRSPNPKKGGALSAAEGHTTRVGTPQTSMPYMYILECCDRSYYVGSTKNLERRLWQHQHGVGANHTAKRLPVKLVYCEYYDRVAAAFYREKQVQGWSRRKKEALMAGDENELHRLAACRNETHYRGVGFGCAQPTSSAQPTGCAQATESAQPTDSHSTSSGQVAQPAEDQQADAKKTITDQNAH